ncbi:MAG: hypothetical protein M0R39_01675 [Prolixibacteraceae bacterium]|jgi:hypothetical protein|nr:hypothetical protein [Prolixibacteraceae bacterium]
MGVKKLILFLFWIFISHTGNAQWSYTMTVTQTGQCIPFPTHQKIYYNTKSACDAARQSDLSYSGSDWSFIGGKCTTTITCSPCIGSDVGNPGSGNGSGQSNSFGIPKSGEVSTNGPLDGKPIFTPHHSQAFEDWATEYKQLLESYGVTSILGNEDKYFKLLYNLWAERFKPKVKSPPPPPPPPPPPVPPASTKINSDASDVDLTGKKGTVKLLTTLEEQKNRDEWYQERIKEQGYTNLTEIGNDDVINGEKLAERSWGEAILRTALGRIDGLEGKIASWELNVADETFKNLNEAVSLLVSGDDEKADKLGNELLGGKVVYNATDAFITEELISAGSDKIVEIGIDKTSNLYKKRAVQSLVDKEQWGIGNLKKIIEVAKDGRENAELGYKWGGIGIELWQNKKGD